RSRAHDSLYFQADHDGPPNRLLSEERLTRCLQCSTAAAARGVFYIEPDKGDVRAAAGAGRRRLPHMHGYLFSRPQPAHEIGEALTSASSDTDDLRRIAQSVGKPPEPV
ncbi:MAG: hypothetical protein KGN84_14475, partial [Acidobacteriota bacterium]|nr:hypothetical protein [Acidobacteriota bacterium]